MILSVEFGSLRRWNSRIGPPLKLVWAWLKVNALNVFWVQKQSSLARGLIDLEGLKATRGLSFISCILWAPRSNVSLLLDQACLALKFFAQSERIKLSLPQAARLHLFLIGKSVVLHLHEGPYQRNTTDGIEKKPSTWQNSNPRRLSPKAQALPLCYNCCLCLALAWSSW